MEPPSPIDGYRRTIPGLRAHEEQSRRGGLGRALGSFDQVAIRDDAERGFGSGAVANELRNSGVSMMPDRVDANVVGCKVDGERFAEHHQRPGSFGSLTGSGIQRLSSMLGEVFKALDGFSARASDHGQGRISDRGQYLWRGTGTGSALILPAGDVAHVVQAVLDAPMASRES